MMYNAVDLPWLQPDSLTFPDIITAQRERDGLVAVGGDLSSARLLSAYQKGIFPWYDQHHPILWWAFPERMVLKTDKLRCSRSLRKSLNNRHYCVTINQAFNSVIRRCARTYRPGQNSTWLTREMQAAFTLLHQQGYAHSFEFWYQGGNGHWQLGGGLYGLLIGRIFFGESMFAHVNDASKIAFVHAVQYLHTLGVPLIDCQVHTTHLARFGAENIPFRLFRQYLDAYCPCPAQQAIMPDVVACSTKPVASAFPVHKPSAQG